MTLVMLNIVVNCTKFYCSFDLENWLQATQIRNSYIPASIIVHAVAVDLDDGGGDNDGGDNLEGGDDFCGYKANVVSPDS